MRPGVVAILQTVLLLAEYAFGEDADYLGCYDVTEQVFQLKNHSVELTSTNSPGSCKVVCYDLGYPYAAVQNGKDCHCGVALNAAHVKTFDKMCQQQPCTGDSASFCGAADAQAVYKTGARVIRWREFKLDNHPADIITFDVGIAAEAGIKQTWLLSKHPGNTHSDVYVSVQSSWQKVTWDRAYTHITVGGAGVYTTDKYSNVERRVGITKEMPQGNGDQALDGTAIKVDSGLNNLYSIGVVPDRVFYLTQIWNFLQQYTTDMSAVSAGKNVVWFLGSDYIHYRMLTGGDPVGTPWQMANDGKVDISASDGDTVAAMDAQGKIYLREGVGLLSMAGTHWAPIPFARTVVKVVADMFDFWVLDDLNRLWIGEIQITDADYLGCFVDALGDRDLSAKSTYDGGGMTVGKCKDFCYEDGYLYAAVQDRGGCYCDNTYGKHGEKPGSDCGSSCFGDFNERCGGWDRNSVYKTGFVSIPDQQVTLGEQLELTCDYPARYAPAHVAWIKDDVVLQNKTVDTALLVSPSELGTVNYQCVINKHPIAVTRNVILTVVDPDLPCINFKTIDDPTRSTGYCGASPTTQQQLVPTQWYRFQGRGGSQLPTQCISENKCGAAVPGWLNGGHPARGDGLVTKEICFHYQGDCCYHSVQVNVHHCFGYYVYKFKENVDLPARVCTEKEPRGTGPSSLITNPLLFMTRPIYNNMALDGFLLANLEAAQSTSCNVLCLLKPLCKSFNYNKTTKECELNTEKATKSIVLTSKLGFSYYHPTGTTVKTTSNN